MDIFKKTALSVCVSVVLAACGGGGGSSESTSSPTFNLVAKAGIDRKSAIGYVSVLNGSESTALSNSGGTLVGETLAFEWKLIEKPLGSSISTTNIQDANSSSAKFTPDIEGIYKIQLTVSLKGVSKSDDISVTVAKPSAYAISDSGQVTSFTDVFGEDNDYPHIAPNITDNGNGTVTDNVTALTWQKDYDGNEYNYYQAKGVISSTYNLEGSSFIDVCGNSTLGGLADWRLPSQHEAMTIISYGSGRKLLWNTVSTSSGDGYWLSEATTFLSSKTIGSYFKRIPQAVLCVSGERLVRNDIWNNEDGTATDFSTGLMWQYPSLKTTKLWVDAIQYCEGLVLAGYSDWRLPNIRELHSISNPKIISSTDKRVYLGTYAFSTEFWSSTSNGSDYAATVIQPSGEVNGEKKSLGHEFACARTL